VEPRPVLVQAAGDDLAEIVDPVRRACLPAEHPIQVGDARGLRL